MHYVVSNCTDGFEILNEALAIYRHSHFAPPFRIFQEPATLAEGQISDVFDRPTGVGWITSLDQLTLCEFIGDDCANVILNLS
jgi:hypothetical protein